MFLGKNISFLRKSLKITQDDLSNSLGIGRGTISNYEKGKSTPDYEKLILISRFFKISIDDLLILDLENQRSLTFINVNNFDKDSQQPIITRFKAYLTRQKISLEKIAENIEESKEATIQILSNEAELTMGHLLKYKQKDPEVNLNFVLTGSGQMVIPYGQKQGYTSSSYVQSQDDLISPSTIDELRGENAQLKEELLNVHRNYNALLEEWRQAAKMKEEDAGGSMVVDTENKEHKAQQLINEVRELEKEKNIDSL